MKVIVKIEKLKDGAHKSAGSFDKASRWYPDEEYRVEGSFKVRGPSRAWPYGYLKHLYTVKYAKMLFAADPLAYIHLQGIEETSDYGKALIALHAAKRLGAEKKELAIAAAESEVAA